MDSEISSKPLNSNQDLLSDLRQFGDRTSSFMTSYPGFRTYRPQDSCAGQIRYMETKRAWVAATEPLASFEERPAIFEGFDQAAREQRKSVIMTPVTQGFSEKLLERGYQRLPIGSEPLFDLAKYFSGVRDPLDRFPHARSLLRRGAVVKEVSANEYDEGLKAQLNQLLENWVGSRATVPLGFLNQIDPWHLSEHKKLFVVEYRGKVTAFLFAVPIFPKAGFFFADYIRDQAARPGTVELLFVEAMRILLNQGYLEVRLGLCPFADAKAQGEHGLAERVFVGLMVFAFHHLRFPLNFKSVYRFKAKFQPTSWQPLFLVSKPGFRVDTVVELARVHFPGGLMNASATYLARKMRPHLNPSVKLQSWPESVAEIFRRQRLTLSFAVLFSSLHVSRNVFPEVQELYDLYPFTAGSYSALGHFLAPLFHNNHYHFAGDLVSFLVFAGALELVLGPIFCGLVVSAGLWLSNPLAWALNAIFLKYYSSSQFHRFLAEIDYGSSNAVYAVVGALAPLLKRPGLLLTPFALNGLFLCFARQSWLSLHHLAALVCGYGLSALLIRMQKKRASLFCQASSQNSG
ncbi:MAG: phosphatidylglycerol lysyltransferase domain-containing protein [Bdellovibrionota bacterium]